MVYDITTLGFYPQTFYALVDGIVLSIQRAHEGLQPGILALSAGELLEANINRSPTAYVENPEWERAMYTHNIDKEMTLLKVADASGRWAGAMVVCFFSMSAPASWLGGWLVNASARFCWSMACHLPRPAIHPMLLSHRLAAPHMP